MDKYNSIVPVDYHFLDILSHLSQKKWAFTDAKWERKKFFIFLSKNGTPVIDSMHAQPNTFYSSSITDKCDNTHSW